MVLQKEERKETKKCPAIKWMYLNCCACQGKGADADRPSVISVSTLKWEKNILKALFFRKWLMVVGWAQGLGSFLCPQLGWCLGLSPCIMETPSEVLSNSQETRSSWSQHLRILQALPPRAKERSRHCTKCTGLQSLASQVSFSIWEGFWGTLLSFPFYLGMLGELLLKSLEAKWHFNSPLKHISPSSCWQTSIYPGKALTKMLWKSIHWQG